jgi:hypothetical protein
LRHGSVGLAIFARDQAVLLAFVAGLLVAICWRDPAGGSLPLSTDLLRDRSGVGAAELLALAVLATLAFRFGGEALLARTDLAVIAAASLAFALPLRPAASLPLTLVGVTLVFRADPRVRSFGQILLALAFYEWVGR